MHVDFDASKPIYQQIIDDFKRAVARGDIRPGDRLPSQREYAEQARVNPNTVQRAYREMEVAGLVQTLRGQGTFIQENPEGLAAIRREMAEKALATFTTEMTALGFTATEILQMVGDTLHNRGNADGGGNAGDGN